MHPSVAHDETFEPITRTVLMAVLFLAGFNLRFSSVVTLTLLLGVALAPVWIPRLRAYSIAPLIVLLGLACVPAGLLLAELSVDRVVSRSLQFGAIGNLLGGLSLMGMVLWARLVLPMHVVAVCFGSGALVNALIRGDLGFKFGLALPLTILIVGGLERPDRRAVAAAAALMLGLIGIFDEARSYFAFCVVAASLTVWQMRPRGAATVSRWFPAVLLGGLGVAIYAVTTSLLTSGYFGPVLQARSTAQIEATGSLLAGGRPEWSASRALFGSRPRGFGLGVIPNSDDYLAAKAGLASIGVDTGGYLKNYMLGGQFRLHSVTSDLWVNYGAIGVVLACVILFALIRSTSYRIAFRDCPTVVTFMATLGLWHMLFGPIYTNWRDVSFALGISLLPVSWTQGQSAVDRVGVR